MTTGTIMTPDPVSVRESETIGHAAATLIDTHYINLPVVDAQGKFVGMFGIYELLGLAVPRVALVGDLLPNLRFLGDDIGELGRKYQTFAKSPVRRAINRNTPVVHPDTALIEVIRLFCRNHTTLAVVERETFELVGIVSHWDALAALTGQAPAKGGRK